MMFKIYKPKFWDKSKYSVFSIILIPFTLIYIVLFNLKKMLTQVKSHPIKTICIGNIYLGGTGKTPLTLKIANELNSKDNKVAIVKKIRSKHTDEINLLKNNFQNFISSNNRNTALYSAVNNDYKIAVLDDGLQDYSFKKTIKIVCFNSKNGFGNMMQIPSGPLRESYKKVREADFVLINGPRNETIEQILNKINYNLNNVFYTNYEIKNINEFKQKKILAFAGIANPNNFFELLTKQGIKVDKKISFPDHYKLNNAEIKSIKEIAHVNNLQILTTEKDFFRINESMRKDINFASINLLIENNKLFFSNLKKKLNENN